MNNHSSDAVISIAVCTMLACMMLMPILVWLTPSVKIQ